MPINKPKVEKHFYTIGEVAEMFDVNASLIRFWENEFDNIKPYKNKKGNRMFTQEAIDEIQLVYHLVKERGMTLKGAQQKIKENKDGVVQDHLIIKRLEHIKEMLIEIKNEL